MSCFSSPTDIVNVSVSCSTLFFTKIFLMSFDSSFLLFSFTRRCWLMLTPTPPPPPLPQPIFSSREGGYFRMPYVFHLCLRFFNGLYEFFMLFVGSRIWTGELQQGRRREEGKDCRLLPSWGNVRFWQPRLHQHPGQFQSESWVICCIIYIFTSSKTVRAGSHSTWYFTRAYTTYLIPPPRLGISADVFWGGGVWKGTENKGELWKKENEGKKCMKRCIDWGGGIFGCKNVVFDQNIKVQFLRPRPRL